MLSFQYANEVASARACAHLWLLAGSHNCLKFKNSRLNSNSCVTSPIEFVEQAVTVW